MKVITLRISNELHQKIKDRAKQQETSINKWLQTWVQAGLAVQVNDPKAYGVVKPTKPTHDKPPAPPPPPPPYKGSSPRRLP